MLRLDTGQRATPANGLLPYFMSILDSQILNLSPEIAIKYGNGLLARVIRWPVSEPNELRRDDLEVASNRLAR